MSCHLNSESHLDPGPIYVRENGRLHMVSLALNGVRSGLRQPKPFGLFSKGFSVELCMNREDDTAQKEKTDHFIFTYTREGNLRYSAKSLFSLVLDFISDNIDHVDSLIGFPEQIAERLFSAAEARQKFTEPGTGLRALRKFTEAYGRLVLCSLCLRDRWVMWLGSWGPCVGVSVLSMALGLSQLRDTRRHRWTIWRKSSVSSSASPGPLPHQLSDSSGFHGCFQG